MSHGLRRGSVVACRRRYGAVWLVDGEVVRLTPIVVSHPLRAHDLRLSEEERLAAGIPRADAVLRAAELRTVELAEQQLVGELPGAVMCRLVGAIVRAAADVGSQDKWASDRRHREYASVPGAMTTRNAGRIVRTG